MIYLAPPTWDATLADGQGGWRAHADAIGSMIDLRSLEQCGSRQDLGGWTLQSIPTSSPVPSEYIALGDNLNSTITSRVRSRLPRTPPLAINIRDYVEHLLSVDPDYDGEDYAPPLMPAARTLHIVLGGQEWSRPIDLTKDTWVLEAKRRQIAAIDDQATREKVATLESSRLGVQFDVIAVEGDKPRTPRTSYADGFTGTGALLSPWVQITGTHVVSRVSDQAKITTTGTAGAHRYEADLSSSDMICSMQMLNLPAGATNMPVLVRFSSVAETCYSGFVRNISHSIAKFVAGTFTSINTASVASSVPFTHTLRVGGSLLTLYKDAVSVLGATDTSITTGVRAGMRWAGTSISDLADNWLVDDEVATASVLPPALFTQGLII